MRSPRGEIKDAMRAMRAPEPNRYRARYWLTLAVSLMLMLGVFGLTIWQDGFRSAIPLVLIAVLDVLFAWCIGSAHKLGFEQGRVRERKLAGSPSDAWPIIVGGGVAAVLRGWRSRLWVWLVRRSEYVRQLEREADRAFAVRVARRLNRSPQTDTRQHLTDSLELWLKHEMPMMTRFWVRVEDDGELEPGSVNFTVSIGTGRRNRG